VFTARYGLIPYIKQMGFRLYEVNISYFASHTFLCIDQSLLVPTHARIMYIYIYIYHLTWLLHVSTGSHPQGAHNQILSEGDDQPRHVAAR
jgi:hypothetical protein